MERHTLLSNGQAGRQTDGTVLINPIAHEWGLIGPRKREIVSIFLIGFK